jgi:serpin B
MRSNRSVSHSGRPSPWLARCLAALLVAACAASPSPASPAGTTAPTAVAPATPASTPGVATPPATASPTVAPATPQPGALSPGTFAVTVSDRLVLRSKPEVSDDSVTYRPYLPTGTDMLVVEGPVAGSGYQWYHVRLVSLALNGGVTEGWVAAADHDGTPWVGAAGGQLAGLRVARSDVARAPAVATDARAAATAVNAFGLDLYAELLGDPQLALRGKNAVFSPTSIAIALAMARAGAQGETARQIDALLRTGGWDDLAAGLNALTQALAARDATWKDYEGKTHALALRIANAAFGQQGWDINKAFLDRIASALGAGLSLVDYIADPEAARNTINAWVSRQTAARIPELLDKPDVTDLTRLILVNAVYMKANWWTEFPVGDTKPRTFMLLDGTRITVPTMSMFGNQDVPYATGSGWKATELDYMGAPDPDGAPTRPLAMTLILPDDLSSFEKQFTPEKLASITKALAKERQTLLDVSVCPGQADAEMQCDCYPYGVELFMPRFGIETRAELADLLGAMGMRLATTPQADFTGITTSEALYIAKVIHQANIDVDETGTEAAAATAIEMSATGGCGPAQPLKTITFRLDHPFLFVLRDVQTGAILFMGRVIDPSKRS